MPTHSILNHIRRLGYTISIHRVNGTVEMHAVKLDGSEGPQIARCDDSDGPDETYRCACLLAKAVGILLEDGYRLQGQSDGMTQRMMRMNLTTCHAE
jgi:hypothetical protein